MGRMKRYFIGEVTQTRLFLQEGETSYRNAGQLDRWVNVWQFMWYFTVLYTILSSAFDWSWNKAWATAQISHLGLQTPVVKQVYPANTQHPRCKFRDLNNADDDAEGSARHIKLNLSRIRPWLWNLIQAKYVMTTKWFAFAIILRRCFVEDDYKIYKGLLNTIAQPFIKLFVWRCSVTAWFAPDCPSTRRRRN